MSRPPRNSPRADPELRVVIGRLCFAAAANAAGIWGTTRLERWLGFTPQTRELLRRQDAGKSRKVKISGPATKTCSGWKRGQVVQDQTLTLIAPRRPEAAARVLEWRDGLLPMSLAVGPSQIRSVALVLRNLPGELWETYLATAALGRHDRQHERRLLARLIERTLKNGDADGLAAILAVDFSSLPTISNRGRLSLELIRGLALTKAANRHPEVDFVRNELVQLIQKRFKLRDEKRAEPARAVVVPFARRPPAQSPCPKAAKNLKFVTEIVAELNRLSGTTGLSSCK